MCSPRSGPRSRRLDAVEAKRARQAGGPSPSAGCSISTTPSRAATCGSASAAATSLTGAQGTPAARAARATRRSCACGRSARAARAARRGCGRGRRTSRSARRRPARGARARRRAAARAPPSGRRRRSSRRRVAKFWNGTIDWCAEFARRTRLVAARGDPGADVVELRERGLEQRQVEVAAEAVAARAPDAGEDRERGDVAAAEVDEREPALRRRPVRARR